MLKKSYEEPQPGIFYMIPNPRTKKYNLYVELEEPGKDNIHLYLWDKVVQKLEMSFKISGVSIADNYRGLPRGRIIAPSSRDGKWIIAHGNDFPLDEFKNEIMSEFTLRDADSLGHVKFEFDPHETMDPRDKKKVEKDLKISITPKGFTLEK